MATLKIHEDKLVMDMHGVDIVWALRSQLSIPLKHVSNVEVRPKDADVAEMMKKRALRVGSYLPGYVTAGYFYMSKAGAIAPDAAGLFEALTHAREAMEAWPQAPATPRQPSHRDTGLEQLARATESMRAAAQELGVDPSETGRGWAFYEIHDPQKTIGFDVSGEKIRRVIIQVDDMSPEDAARMIQDAVKGR